MQCCGTIQKQWSWHSLIRHAEIKQKVCLLFIVCSPTNLALVPGFCMAQLHVPALHLLLTSYHQLHKPLNVSSLNSLSRTWHNKLKVCNGKCVILISDMRLFPVRCYIGGCYVYCVLYKKCTSAKSLLQV